MYSILGRGSFALITASIQRGMEVISLWHCWGGDIPVATRIKVKTLMLAYRRATGSSPSYFPSLITIYIPSRSPAYFHSLITIYIPSRSPAYFHSLITIYIPSRSPAYFHSLITIYIPSRSPAYFHSLITIYIPSRSPAYFHSLITIYIPSRSPAYFHSLITIYIPSRSARSAGECCLVVHHRQAQNHSPERFNSLFLAGGMNFPCHPESWIPDNFQAPTENSSLPSSLDLVLKKKTPPLSFLTFALFSFTSHCLARFCSEHCLYIYITSNSYVCLPLYNVSLIVFLNCKSLWIKASAKLMNVNVWKPRFLWQ